MSTYAGYYKGTERERDREHSDHYHHKRNSMGTGYEDTGGSGNNEYGGYGASGGGFGSNPVRESIERDREYEEVRRREVEKNGPGYSHSEYQNISEGLLSDNNYGQGAEGQVSVPPSHSKNRDEYDDERRKDYTELHNTKDDPSASYGNSEARNSSLPRNDNAPSNNGSSWQSVTTNLASAAASQLSKAYDKASSLNAKEASSNRSEISSRNNPKEQSAFARRLDQDGGDTTAEPREGSGNILESVVGGASEILKNTFGGK